MSNTWIKVAYAGVLAVVLAMTVGFGVATFITPPRAPQPVGITFTDLNNQNATDQQTTRQEKQIDSFYQDAQNQRASYPEYQRNLFLALAGIGMVVAVLGVALPAVVNYLRLGFILGGVLLALAAVYVAVQAVPNAIPPTSSVLTLLGLGQPTVLDTAGRFLRFAVSVVGLLVLIFVGLWRLTDWAVAPRVVLTPVAAAPVVAVPAAPVAPAAPHTADADRWSRPEDRVSSPPSYSPPSYAPPPPFAAPVPSTAEVAVEPTLVERSSSAGETVEQQDPRPL